MELTIHEKRMRIVSLLYAVIFFITILVFIFFQSSMFLIINTLSSVLCPGLPEASDSGKFWLSMTISMMAGVTFLSYMMYVNVRKYYIFAIPLVVMKFTSAAMGLLFFLGGILYPSTGWNTLANLIIFITDFPLGMVMLYLYKKTAAG